MLFSLWSAKAGAGCTAIAIALANDLAIRRGSALLVDVGGDVPSCAGLDPAIDGLTDWLRASRSSIDAMARLEIAIGSNGVDLLPLGSAHRWSATRQASLLQLLAHDPRPVVVDVGHVPARPQSCLERLRERFVIDADQSFLVSRQCYLSMRRALASPLRSNGVILVRETERALDAFDVAHLLSLPVVAQVDHDPLVSRALDSGTFASRVPKLLGRQLRGVA